MVRSVTNQTLLSLSPLTPSWLMSSLTNQALLSEGMVGDIYQGSVYQTVSIRSEQTIQTSVKTNQPSFFHHFTHLFRESLHSWVLTAFLSSFSSIHRCPNCLSSHVIASWGSNFSLIILFSTHEIMIHKRWKNWLVLVVLAEKRVTAFPPEASFQYACYQLVSPNEWHVVPAHHINRTNEITSFIGRMDILS